MTYLVVIVLIVVIEFTFSERSGLIRDFYGTEDQDNYKEYWY